MFSVFLILQGRLEAVYLSNVKLFASKNWNSFHLSKKQFRAHGLFGFLGFFPESTAYSCISPLTLKIQL